MDIWDVLGKPELGMSASASTKVVTLFPPQAMAAATDAPRSPQTSQNYPTTESTRATRRVSVDRRAGLIEQLGVVAILTTMWCFNGCQMTDVITSGAVFLGFLYAQLSFDVAESIEGTHAGATRSSLRFLFMAKEGLWLLAFMAVQSWPLVFGSLLFSGYPLIRNRLRQATRAGQTMSTGAPATPTRRAVDKTTGDRRGCRALPSTLRKRAPVQLRPAADHQLRQRCRSP